MNSQFQNNIEKAKAKVNSQIGKINSKAHDMAVETKDVLNEKVKEFNEGVQSAFVSAQGIVNTQTEKVNATIQEAVGAARKSLNMKGQEETGNIQSAVASAKGSVASKTAEINAKIELLRSQYNEQLMAFEDKITDLNETVKQKLVNEKQNLNEAYHQMNDKVNSVLQ